MSHITTHQLDELALWFERELHETIGWARGSRLYGLTVNLGGKGNSNEPRRTFLADGWVYDLLEGSSALVAATRFDALGLCCFGKATNLDTLETFRCRTVLVANAHGQCVVNRIRGREPELSGRATGPVAQRVEALFHQT